MESCNLLGRKALLGLTPLPRPVELTSRLLSQLQQPAIGSPGTRLWLGCAYKATPARRS